MIQTKSQPMTVSEFSAFLRVSRHKVYEKIRSGEIPALHFGRRVLIDLDEALESMRRERGKTA
ncbi:MAG: helix-turn-helix domain-containing protein [Nitrospirae bacterium]|nr:helix-turn-helix domain-containing protein [Nitrospirota bacterium]